MTTPSSKGRRARRMWASCGKVGKMRLSFQVYQTKEEATNYGDYPSSVAFPVIVLPASPEDVERLVEAVKWAIGPENQHTTLLHTTREDKYDLAARAVLKALGGGK